MNESLRKLYAAADSDELEEPGLETVAGGTTTIHCSPGARFLFG